MVSTQGSAMMSQNSSRVLTVILGGGAGTRLFPLTRSRAKPAVPLGGKYRLVDIPISNCINSDLKRVYLLTQFNSASLHRHIAASYKFDHFSSGFVEILAAEQTYGDTSWYQGTADAVRKNLVHLLNHDFDLVLILSGDQLYRMDYRPLIQRHLDVGAEITVATIPVLRRDATGLGILQVDAEQQITRFVEKPTDPVILDELVMPPALTSAIGLAPGDEGLLLASMGIYLFNRDTLIDVLKNDLADFGKHIIPGAIGSRRMSAYVFQGYWEDIGTIRAFFEANLDLTSELPRFNFFRHDRADLHAAAVPAGLQDQRRPHRSRDHFRRVHPDPRRRPPVDRRHPQRADARGAAAPDDPARVRLLRIRVVDRRARGARAPARGDWLEHVDRERDHRQERAHRQQRGHLAPRQAGSRGSRALLHSRRRRHHPEERDRAARDGHLIRRPVPLC
jgi:glucose-1-phosphate adenylyltransferase